MARIRIEGFVLDTEARLLTKDGCPVHLAPKALDLLDLLLDRRPNAVSREIIHKHLWPDTFVAEVNLPVLIHRLREALRDDPRQPRFVRTVTRFGYAYCGTAWVESEAGTTAGNPFEYRVVLAGKEVVLRDGVNLLGRAHDAVVRTDQASVSRRHALIRIDGRGATIEDCGSKNGTFKGSERVSGPVELRDDDRILLGSVALVFRCRKRRGAENGDPASRPTAPLFSADILEPLRSHV